MARLSSKATILFSLVLLVSLLLAESRQIGIGFGRGQARAECDSVYGAEDGDTCTSVAKKFDVSLEFFTSINPNINCDDIFVGQWLCVDGTA
ncbi:hypothetical protein JCGZ_25851 [Jatropha curcas]|uniref:LysM domain-containing protein n=1 Tax=Jatropha curcas TaxID=180498 RepID=A0A067JXE6_JATCU|nr:hypothetical protein JCGZ_25851 [Jatropha curcas]